MCIYSPASLRGNTGSWQGGSELFKVSVSPHPWVFLERLFVAGQRLPSMFDIVWEVDNGQGAEWQHVSGNAGRFCWQRATSLSWAHLLPPVFFKFCSFTFWELVKLWQITAVTQRVLVLRRVVGSSPVASATLSLDQHLTPCFVIY